MNFNLFLSFFLLFFFFSFFFSFFSFFCCLIDEELREKGEKTMKKTQKTDANMLLKEMILRPHPIKMKGVDDGGMILLIPQKSTL